MQSISATSGPTAWRGANTLFTFIFLLVGLLTVGIFVFTQEIVKFTAPGLPNNIRETAVDLTRLLLPVLFILALNGILSSISQCYQRFAITATDGIVTNLAIIGGILYFEDKYGIFALVGSVIVGFLVQAMILLGANLSILLQNLRPILAFRHPDFIGLIKHAIPLGIGYFGAVISGIVDQIFVSFLPQGSISALSYAGMISMLPVEVFSQAIMTTFYPRLSNHYANRDVHGLVETHLRGVRMIFLLILPSAAVLLVLAEPIVIILLERGNFTELSTASTASAVMFLSIGIIARSITYFNYRVLHAMIQPWTQVKIGLVGVLTNAVLNALLIRPLGLGGIALATSLSLIQSAVLSTWVIQRRLQISVAGPMAQAARQILLMTLLLIVTSLLMGQVCIAGLRVVERAWQSVCLLGGLLPGVMVFSAIGILLKQEETLMIIRTVWGSIRAQFNTAATR
jgi:putative peptidoglycan lipid II flippase